MKNSYCNLTREQINALEVPDHFKGLLLSPFQFNLRDGFVLVPEDAFKDFVFCAENFLKKADKESGELRK